MKLRNLPIKESTQQIRFSLRNSLAASLSNYAEYASITSGTNLDVSEVTASIVTTFMEDDKDFQNWLKKKDAQTKGEN
jgi:hypothetical protein